MIESNNTTTELHSSTREEALDWVVKVIKGNNTTTELHFSTREEALDLVV